MEAHRFRRDFLHSSRAGPDRPTRPEPPSLFQVSIVPHSSTTPVPEICGRNWRVVVVLSASIAARTIEGRQPTGSESTGFNLFTSDPPRVVALRRRALQQRIELAKGILEVARVPHVSFAPEQKGLPINSFRFHLFIVLIEERLVRCRLVVVHLIRGVVFPLLKLFVEAIREVLGVPQASRSACVSATRWA